MANDLSTRPVYPGYIVGDLVRVHRPGAPNADYKSTPQQIKLFLDAAGIDHGSLDGLADDDHEQYLNLTRGDARYYTKAQIDVIVTTINGRLTALEAGGGGGGETLSDSILWYGRLSATTSLFSADTWNIIPFDVEMRDTPGNIVVSGGTVEIPAGSYLITCDAFVFTPNDNVQPKYELAISYEDGASWINYLPVADTIQPISAGGAEDNGVRFSVTVPITVTVPTTITARVRSTGEDCKVKASAVLWVEKTVQTLAPTGGGSSGTAGDIQFSDGAGGFSSNTNLEYISDVGGFRFPFGITSISELGNPTWTALAASVALPIVSAHTYIQIDNQPASTEGEGSATYTINIPASNPTIPLNTEIVYEVTIKNAHASNQLLVASGAGFTVAEGAIARAARLLPGGSDVLKYRYRYTAGGGVWLCEGVPAIKDSLSFYYSRADGGAILANEIIAYFGASGLMTVPGWVSDVGTCFVTPTPTAQQTINLEERTSGPDVWTQRGTLTIAASSWTGLWTISPQQVDSNRPWRLRAASNLSITTIHGFLNVMKKVQF